MTRLLPLGVTAAAATVGAKASRLSAALRAGLPVLGGWVVPCAQARPALSAAASAVRRGEAAAARRAALSCPLDPVLGVELAAAVSDLGGRVIVRSSSPLEQDPRWSGAFSSIAEIGVGDVVTAVRSCWAAAFAADPLARLASCGLAPDALELAVVIQPELRPGAGGTARVIGTKATGDVEVDVATVAGHPGALLAGWAEGSTARLRVPSPGPAGPLGPPGRVGLPGRPDLGFQVASLAARVHSLLGDDTIEWAAQDGTIWLLQSMTSAAVEAPPAADPSADPGGEEPTDRFADREWMPVLAAMVRARGHRVPARPAAAGTAAGRLVPCRPHEPAAASCRDAILLVDLPVPALAPLLFGARGLIARSGSSGSHLAEVARSLGVPMVTGCKLPAPEGSWLAAIDGTVGEVALLPG